MMQPSAELLLMPTNHKLIYFNEVDKGGHFATWEQPELFATELRAAFRSLRWLDRGAAAVRSGRRVLCQAGICTRKK